MDTLSTQSLDELTNDELNHLTNFLPAISDEQMGLMEEAANDNARGLQRRLCLSACAQSADTLSKLNIVEPGAFAEMLEMIEAFKEHTAALSEVAESAYNRMIIASCRTEQEA